MVLLANACMYVGIVVSDVNSIMISIIGGTEVHLLLFFACGCGCGCGCGGIIMCTCEVWV